MYSRDTNTAAEWRSPFHLRLCCNQTATLGLSFTVFHARRSSVRCRFTRYRKMQDRKHILIAFVLPTQSEPRSTPTLIIRAPGF